MASLRTAAGGRALASAPSARPVSSLRIRPFQLNRGQQQPSRQLLRLRVAEPEAAAPPEGAPPEEDFEFNLNDAKKGNEYEDSDVEAALRYYYENGAAPSANEDFVANMFGGEDASFFDDIDNEDDGDWDDYAIAGISEAAPKKGSGNDRGAEGGAAEEEDGAAQGQKLAMLQAMEDQMVLDADMEDVFGGGGSGAGRAAADRASDSAAADAAAWGWLGGPAAAVEAAEEAVEGPQAGGAGQRYSNAVLPSDDEVFSAFSALKVDELDEQTRDMLELIIGDDPSDQDLLGADAEPEDADVPTAAPFTDEELATMDTLVQHPLPDLAEFEELMPEGAEPKVTDDADSLVTPSQKSFDAYIASLKQAAAADSDVSMTYQQVTDMFSSSGVPVVEDQDTGPAAELPDLLAEEPQIPAQAELDVPTDFGPTEVGDAEIQEIKEELLSLASIEQFTEYDMPDEQQLEILDQYLNAVEAVDAQDKGEEDVPDLETEYADDLIADLAESDENPVDVVNYDVDDEDDGETWLERVIELTRVTKVTKGGKVIGFRCTAVVGNQKGLVGVGCQSGIEIGIATKRALVDAKRNVVKVDLVGAGTIPHKSEAKFHAARCILVPASDGTGVIAGGSIKAVLELAGVQNVLAKRLGCRSLLNNARCTVKALQQLRTLYDVSRSRGVPMDQLLLPVDA